MISIEGLTPAQAKLEIKRHWRGLSGAEITKLMTEYLHLINSQNNNVEIKSPLQESIDLLNAPLFGSQSS